MSKLSVFDAINKLVGNSIRIYTGPIHKVYADDFELDRRGRPLHRKKYAIVKKYANFYICDESGDIFESIELGYVLPTHEDALKYCDDTFNKNKTAITNVLNGRVTDPKEAHRILESIKADSACEYYIPSELQYSHDMSKKDFKLLIKKREERDNKNKK